MFKKISISVKIVEKFQFFPKIRKIAILVKFSENFEKLWFWSNFQMFRFEEKFRKILILVKFSQIFRFCSKFLKNFEFLENIEKFWF